MKFFKFRYIPNLELRNPLLIMIKTRIRKVLLLSKPSTSFLIGLFSTTLWPTWVQPVSVIFSGGPGRRADHCPRRQWSFSGGWWERSRSGQWSSQMSLPGGGREGRQINSGAHGASSVRYGTSGLFRRPFREWGVNSALPRARNAHLSARGAASAVYQHNLLGPDWKRPGQLTAVWISPPTPTLPSVAIIPHRCYLLQRAGWGRDLATALLTSACTTLWVHLSLSSLV